MSSDGSRLSGPVGGEGTPAHVAEEEEEEEEEEDSSNLFPPHASPRSSSANGSGLSMAGFGVLVLLTLYSLRLSMGQSCLASWTVWTRTTVLIVRSSSIPAVAYARLVLLVFLALCSFTLSPGPRCSASWLVWTRRTVMQWAGFIGDDAPRAVLPFIVVGPKMFGIMACMTPNDGSGTWRRAENCRNSAVAVHQGRRHVLRVAEANLHGPCDHGGYTVARG